jgi:hypothetical protein
MITKPEEAIPRYVGGLVTRGSEWFTGKECAEIARAYADCVAAEMMSQSGDHGDAWRMKFEEWEGK